MKSMNKKGVWSDIKSALLAIAILGVSLYILWAYVFHGILPQAHTFEKCEGLSGNNGLCKESCDSTTEFAFPGVGCGNGKASTCCVRKNPNMNDVILPGGYGGDKSFEFEVVSINFGALPGKCAFDTTDPLKSKKTIICPPNYQQTIPIEITVRNLYGAIIVFADPVIVINGNGDKMSKFGKYIGNTNVNLPKNTAAAPAPGPEFIIKSDIKIASSEAIENDYWEIYPYVKCETKECKKTDDPAGRGILNYNTNDVLTISFEK